MSSDIRALPFLKFIPLLILANNTLFAEDIIVITAERIKSNTSKSTSNVRIIDAEEIKKSQSRSLPEILSKESDINVVSSGQSGSSSSLFLRGTDSSHTLVVIDGIVMNDPSNPNRQFDIGRLSLNNVERIEILKGSQGLAYGSNAIGGVIVITTKKAVEDQLKGSNYLDYGTFNTVNTGIDFQRKYEFANLSFGADYMDTDGFSASNQKYNSNAEKDSSQRAGFSLGANKDLSENYTLDLNLRFSRNTTDLDKGGGAGNDDPNDNQKEVELYSKMQLTKNWDTGNAQTIFSYNHSKHRRELEILFDATHSAHSSTVTIGEINSLNANHTYYINEQLTQNFNVEFAHEKDQTKHFNQNLSAFLYHQYELPSSIFNFGLRLDHNKFFNDYLTYKLAAGYKLSSSLLKLSHSTGFRAPSLNQLYDPTYGNKNLDPETSRSIDLSLDKKWTEEFKTTTTLFYTTLKDRFSYAPVTFINLNSGNAEIMGLEQSLGMDWSENFNHSLSFTLLKARDISLGKKLARRPDVNLKNTLSIHLASKHHVEYEFSFTGQRADVDNDGRTVSMPSYLLSNLNYRYAIDIRNDFYLKIKNAFDTEYEEIYGYGTGGRAFTAGMQYSF